MSLQRLIFTHNNADFDAVASLLAMHRLDPTAVPVLPLRLRQNVRKFLTLYAGLMPAIPIEELPDDLRLVYAYLLDTQNFRNIPYIDANTIVHIVDHHRRRSDLPSHYTLLIDDVGSTTTLLVEQMRQQSIAVSSLEATMLLLGIYEDTGSLTYGGTTVRDMQAATWLLENGANLDILREFLTYPLEESHWELYEQLRQSATIEVIGGHAVLLATAQISQQVEGVSRLAHHIMNLYDPSALFLLIQMGGDVQLVARSTLDEIDAGMVAKAIGGGGHIRAAAGLLRQSNLEQALQLVRAALPAAITPSATVAELMSAGRIETISADASAQQAAQKMQISGHEGYPVIDGDRVVGLLTRRAVDRAMSHAMPTQLVRQMMESGTDIYVQPADSLEVLRQKMMDTGWGQMPVLDESGHLIGIVTRTDLIRRWGMPPRSQHQQHLLMSRLQDMLPLALWQLLTHIANQAQAADVDIYLVGGLVRDLLLNIRNLDIDIVVEGDAIGFAITLQKSLGGHLHTHQQFGTAKWVINREVIAALDLGVSDEERGGLVFIDFATARAEFYKEPSVLPTVRQSSIKQDLHRRDFTINSMALRLSPPPMGLLIDFYNGERDLNHKIIRVLHSHSFIDDPTRMMRAVRFEQRLDFSIEPRTLSLLDHALPFLDRVTGERLRNELWHILAEQDPLRGLKRLQNLGILDIIFPNIQIDDWFEQTHQTLRYAQQQPLWADLGIDWTAAQAALMVIRHTPDQINEWARRLMIGRTLNLVFLAIHDIIPQLPQLENMRPSDISDILSPLSPLAWPVLWSIAADDNQRQPIEHYVTTWRHIQPTIDGHRLKAEGVPPGPVMGDLIRQLRRAWLDGDITTPDEETAYLRRLIENLAP